MVQHGALMGATRTESSDAGSPCHRSVLRVFLFAGLLVFGPWARAQVVLKAPSVKANATTAHSDCRLCHQSHPSGMSLKATAKKGNAPPQMSAPDAMCLNCHQGPSNPAKDLGASKLPAWAGMGSSHIDGPFLEKSRAYSRMVERGARRKPFLKPQCDGCHDVHMKDRPGALSGLAFDAQGKPMKAKAITAAQVCFGCHAGTEATRLARNEPDLGALFRGGAGSAHMPGAMASKRPELASLRNGLFQGALDCTSCHDNPNPSGPKGPHASSYPFLLKASYGREGDVARSGERSDELCYSCHDKFSVMGNQSFPFHAQHINGFTGNAPVKGMRESRLPGWSAPTSRAVGGLPAGGAFSPGFGQPTPCATCHDPHGSPKNAALLNFDKGVVSRSSVGAIEFQKSGPGHGNCTLTCHGYDHVQTRY